MPEQTTDLPEAVREILRAEERSGGVMYHVSLPIIRRFYEALTAPLREELEEMRSLAIVNGGESARHAERADAAERRLAEEEQKVGEYRKGQSLALREKDDAERRLEEAREALEPFAHVARGRHPEDPTPAVEAGPHGGRWTEFGVGLSRDRIVDWFGPSDFFAAGKVFATLQDSQVDQEPYDGEICRDCNLPVARGIGSYWRADDSLWQEVVGDDPSVILCPACFTERAGREICWEPRVISDSRVDGEGGGSGAGSAPGAEDRPANSCTRPGTASTSTPEGDMLLDEETGAIRPMPPFTEPLDDAPEEECICLGEREEAPAEPDVECPVHGSAPTPEQPEESTCGGSGEIEWPRPYIAQEPRYDKCPGCKDCTKQEVGGEKEKPIAGLNIPNPECWECIVGETGPEFRSIGGQDAPMRRAVAKAYVEITGKEPDFIFSGWGKELPEEYRAVVENREPIAGERDSRLTKEAVEKAVRNTVAEDFEMVGWAPGEVEPFVGKVLAALDADGEPEDCDDICRCGHERFHHMVNDEDPGPCVVCGCAAFGDATEIPTTFTKEQCREKLLTAIESARQGHVRGPNPITVEGDLFRSERESGAGVQVIALDDFNTALDAAFGDDR